VGIFETGYFCAEKLFELGEHFHAVDRAAQDKPVVALYGADRVDGRHFDIIFVSAPFALNISPIRFAISSVVQVFEI